MKTIEDCEFCPRCGSNLGYYKRIYVSGWMRDVTFFPRDRYTGVLEKCISQEADSLNYSRESKYYYCFDCDKRICKVEET